MIKETIYENRVWVPEKELRRLLKVKGDLLEVELQDDEDGKNVYFQFSTEEEG